MQVTMASRLRTVEDHCCKAQQSDCRTWPSIATKSNSAIRGVQPSPGPDRIHSVKSADDPSTTTPDSPEPLLQSRAERYMSNPAVLPVSVRGGPLYAGFPSQIGQQHHISIQRHSNMASLATKDRVIRRAKPKARARRQRLREEGVEMRRFRATHRIFTIPELAEAIFLQLPPQQILVNIQRVAKKWQEIVLESLPIQQALFFKPITTDALHFIKQPGENRGGSWRDQQGRAHKVFENRTFRDILPPSGTMMRCVPENWEEIKRPEASWRRQLLTQPPVASISLRTEQTKGWDWTEEKADGVGVTMEQMWKLMFSEFAISDWSLWENYDKMWKSYTAEDALHMMMDKQV